MKKVPILFIVLLALSSFDSYSKTLTEHEKLSYRSKSVLNEPAFHRFDTEDLVELVEEVVPHKYLAAFFHYSQMPSREDTDRLRLYLLALGDVESEWAVTRSHKRNKDGSYDWGYLMLNERNIADKKFMASFGPSREFPGRTNIETWLITCINFFKYLYAKYGCDGLYAYNAGEKSYFYDRIPASTYIYKYKIKCKVDSYTERLYSIADYNRRIKSQRQIILVKAALEELHKERIALRKAGISRGDSNKSYLSCQGHDGDIDQLLYDPRKRYVLEVVSEKYYIMSTIKNEKYILNAILA